MTEQELLLHRIHDKQPINQEEIIISPITGDGNCFYRAISLYFTNEQTNHKIIREIIYEAAKEYKEDIKPFFLTGISDEILADAKLENYIEKIKNDSFYAGIIELSLAAKIFYKTIIVYSNEENNDYDESNKKENFYKNESDKMQNIKDNNFKDSLGDSETKIDPIKYTHLTTIEKPNEKFESLEEIILLIYDPRIKHFSLVLTKDIDFNQKGNLKNKKYEYYE